VQKIYGEIQALGGEVIVVSFAPPRALAFYLKATPQPFPVVSDPDRTVYHAFSLGRTRLLAFLRPSVIWHYLRLIFRGWLPKGPGEDKDVMQLGGDFVIDRAGRLAYAYPSKDAADRPSNDVLLTALRSIAV
jgi:peroxiredoxin